jgi:hypothetical protein
MVNRDYGPNDCGDTTFRKFTYLFTPCDMKLKVSLGRYTYKTSPPSSCVKSSGLVGSLLNSKLWCNGVTLSVPQGQLPTCLQDAITHKCDPTMVNTQSLAAKDSGHVMFTAPFEVGDVNFDDQYDTNDFAMATSACNGDGRYAIDMVFRCSDLNWKNPLMLTNSLVATPPMNSFTDRTATNVDCIYYRLGVTK